MTENEKLRALLAEAREWVRAPSNRLDDVSEVREFRQRIDAALADTGEREPQPEWDKTKVYDTEQMLDVRNALLEVNAPSGNTPAEQIRAMYSVFLDDFSKIERKLAEAQDEVERLKADLEVVDDDLTLAVKRLTAEVVRLQGAYKRGTEAMREAAASCVGSDVALLQTYRSVLEGRIRDLPVPKDEP